MNALRQHLDGWLAGRSARERLLVLAAAGATLALLAILVGRTWLDDLALARARVAAHEHELTDVRRLAATLRRSASSAAPEEGDGASLLARLETAVGRVVGRERIASMTPESGAVEDGVGEERVTLRVSSATLPDTVRLLHALATGSPPVAVTGLALRKHPDDSTRFDATFEVAEPR